MQEKYSMIPYQGSQINLFSDDRNDYVSLTDIYTAWNRYSKSISAWLKTRQTLEFLNVWELKHNPKYKETHLSQAIKIARERNGLSAQTWVELTSAIGIFTKTGEKAGTYAHKDIAIKFAGWLSPAFELYLVEELQRLKEIEKQKDSFELLNHEQILYLVRLKEVFKYVAHHTIVEDAHKDVFAARSGSKNPFAEFNTWRNKVLDISPQIIDDRIKQYCIDNKIALTTKILSKTKKDKIIMLDSYEAVKIAVWDFLQIEGAVNALNLANLVKDIIKTEKGELIRENKTDLFHNKQDLGKFNDFKKEIESMKQVQTARQVLELRKQIEDRKKSKPISDFDKNLNGLLNVPPPKKVKE